MSYEISEDPFCKLNCDGVPIYVIKYVRSLTGMKLELSFTVDELKIMKSSIENFLERNNL